MTTVSRTGAGSVTIMSAWAVADPPAATGIPYRDEVPLRLVCTLCGNDVATCASCGMHFKHGDRIDSDACIVLQGSRRFAPPQTPPSWWERFLVKAHLRTLPVEEPQPEPETKWVAASRPHFCADSGGNVVPCRMKKALVDVGWSRVRRDA